MLTPDISWASGACVKTILQIDPDNINVMEEKLDQNKSPEVCIKTCKNWLTRLNQRGLSNATESWAGVAKGGECWCGTKKPPPFARAHESLCEPCGNDNSLKCGGNETTTVYGPKGLHKIMSINKLIISSLFSSTKDCDKSRTGQIRTPFC